MITARRLLAAASAGAVALTLLADAPPASAQEPPEVKWTRPTMGSTLDDQGAITGEITGDADHTIKEVSVRVEPMPPRTDAEDPCLVDLAAQTFDIPPPVTFTFDVNFPCNGNYELAATVSYEQPVIPVVGSRPDPATSMVEFSMAVPPAQVRGLEETYDPASREVRLTWDANSERDLIGYYVERSSAGGEFNRIGDISRPMPGTSFTDPNIGDKNRYRVVAVRRGPTSDIVGRASLPQTSGPDSPDNPDAPAPAPSPSAARDSGAGNRSSGSGDRSRPSSRPRTQDNVFEESLPFDPSQTTTTVPGSRSGPPSLSASPPEDAAVLSEVDATEAEQRRATFLPVAGGLALIVGAMHLFVLSKQAGEADIPIVAGRPPGGGRGASW